MITLGREARPGEEYEIIGGLDAPGEPLHCVPFYNRPVSEVRALLKGRMASLAVGDAPMSPEMVASQNKKTGCPTG